MAAPGKLQVPRHIAKSAASLRGASPVCFDAIATLAFKAAGDIISERGAAPEMMVALGTMTIKDDFLSEERKKFDLLYASGDEMGVLMASPSLIVKVIEEAKRRSESEVAARN